MLGLVLIYFIGKYYYDLAKKYGKNEWGHGVLGVVTYYAGTFVLGIALVIVMDYISPGWIGNINEFLLGLIALPFGLLATWGLYKFLENKYVNEMQSGGPAFNADILDDEL